VIAFDSLVISIPAQEMAADPYQGSVFDASRIKTLSVPPDLKVAVELFAGAHAGGTPLKCIARPEMFTHGRAREWLGGAIGGATNHLALSDGRTLKLIPGLKNHVFVYGLQSAERRLALKRLLRQAPELFPQFASQVNSVHQAPVGSLPKVPALALLRPEPATAPMMWFYPFYFNRHSLEDSVDHVLGWGAPEAVHLKEFKSVTYLPLTECAIEDSGFTRLVAESISRAYFQPGGCLLIRLPLPGAELAKRIHGALEGIAAAAVALPRARAQNIFLLAQDIGERALMAIAPQLSLVMHQSVEFWRYTRSLYESAATVRVCLERGEEQAAPLKNLYAQAFGRPADILTLERTTDGVT